jgi:hypothetical protein
VHVLWDNWLGDFRPFTRLQLPLFTPLPFTADMHATPLPPYLQAPCQPWRPPWRVMTAQVMWPA